MGRTTHGQLPRFVRDASDVCTHLHLSASFRTPAIEAVPATQGASSSGTTSLSTTGMPVMDGAGSRPSIGEDYSARAGCSAGRLEWEMPPE